MPIYEYACPNGHIFSQFCRVADHSPLTVCDCGETAQQIIGAPSALKVPEECRYDSPIDGTPITTYAARANDLARSGCRPYDPGMRQDHERRLAENEKALDQSIHESVERSVAKMNTKQRGQLWNEMTRAGVDANVQRH